MVATDNGKVVVGATLYGTINVGEQEITSYSNSGILIEYNNNGEVKWVQQLTESNNYAQIYSLASTKDNGFVVGGYFAGEINLNGTIIKRDMGGFIIKYDYNKNLKIAEALSEIQK